MKLFLTFILIGVTAFAKAQDNDPELFVTLSNITTAERIAIPVATINTGSIVYDVDLKAVFRFDGSDWNKVEDDENKIVATNELIFNDTPFYYVSMQINTADYCVIRYDRTDVNVEARSEGTGAQPTTLSACQALTYN